MRVRSAFQRSRVDGICLGVRVKGPTAPKEQNARTCNKTHQIQSPQLHRSCRTPCFVSTNSYRVIDSPLWPSSTLWHLLTLWIVLHWNGKMLDSSKKLHLPSPWCQWRTEEWKSRRRGKETGKQMQWSMQAVWKWDSCGKCQIIPLRDIRTWNI